jgi:hypothetical protein
MAKTEFEGVPKMSVSSSPAHRFASTLLLSVTCSVAAFGQIPGTPQVPTPLPDQTNPYAVNPDASIYSPEPSVDFGEILQGEVKPHTFTIGNRGKEPIEVRSVNPTCGCTVAFLKTKSGEVIDPKKLPLGKALHTLAPDETCEVSIEFNSAGQPTHQLEKIIMVISSDDKQPALRLSLRANVVMPLALEPNLLQFGELVKGEEKTVSATGVLSRVENLEITGWEQKPEWIDVKTELITTPANQKAIRFDVTIKGTAPLGYQSTTLVANTTDAKLKSIRVPIYANIKSQVVFDSGSANNKEKLDFQVIKFGEERTRSLTIKNLNPAVPYVVTGVDVESAHKDKLKVDIVTITEGVEYRIDVTTAKDLDAKYFRGNLKIKANHADTPEKLITLLGWVRK